MSEEDLAYTTPICRPRYIHVDLYDYDTHKDIYYTDLRAKCKKVNNLGEFMSKPIPNEIGYCYFWLKDLEEVGIEVRDEEAKEWNSVEGTSSPDSLSIKMDRAVKQVI
ncbi:hypothetical protein CASFOL_022052 [Castilleja foliolosa]|uniref:Uncharacterized protein n=1 Tax=Castilleja foliolosa TaxID=1961234 RepID=A0ABD3CZ61_9LAMI